MIVYLISTGYTSTHVGLVRTVSVAFEISSTFLAPALMSRIGAVRAGLWFISWQMLCIGSAVTFFWNIRTPIIAGSGLVVGVILSRMGVWGFDLSVQSIVQAEVEAEFRGEFSSLEASLQNLFELFSYASTIAFSEPEMFRWPASTSALALFAAGLLYVEFVRWRRGHLLHMSTCVGGKG
jgi:iron-regulated transporter 1